VAYVRLRKVLPYGRQKCVSTFGHAIREYVHGAVVYTSDPKGILLFSSYKPKHTHFKFIAMTN